MGAEQMIGLAEPQMTALIAGILACLLGGAHLAFPTTIDAWKDRHSFGGHVFNTKVMPARNVGAFLSAFGVLSLVAAFWILPNSAGS